MNKSDESALRVAVIVLAAGSGSRFGHSTNKVWLTLDNQKIISHSLKNATESFISPRIVLVINPLEESLAINTLTSELIGLEVELVYGGNSRHESEFNALMHISQEIENGNVDVVLIHDGARPLASSQLFATIAKTAYEFGGALPAISVDPLEMEEPNNKRVVRVQTPQAFRAKEVLDAYRQSERDKFLGTDTAACMEKYFPEMKYIAVEGEVQNIKITYARDLIIAERTLEFM